MASRYQFTISVPRETISVSCGTISKGCGAISIHRGTISKGCGWISVGCDWISEITKTCDEEALVYTQKKTEPFCNVRVQISLFYSAVFFRLTANVAPLGEVGDLGSLNFRLKTELCKYKINFKLCINPNLAKRLLQLVTFLF